MQGHPLANSGIENACKYLLRHDSSGFMRRAFEDAEKGDTGSLPEVDLQLTEIKEQLMHICEVLRVTFPADVPPNVSKYVIEHHTLPADSDDLVRLYCLCLYSMEPFPGSAMF